MGKQKEGSLQERIQKLITQRGGYCFKNHGDMTTKPGRPDIICCYKSLFIAIEAKVDNNKPSPQQGIHCRNIWKADGIACVVWSTDEVNKFLDLIDNTYYVTNEIQKGQNALIKAYLEDAHIDDGTRW